MLFMHGAAPEGDKMKTTSIAAKVAGLAIAGLLFAPSVASAQLCIVGVMIAAFHANATEHRELTSKEAMSCGLLHETETPKPKKKLGRRAKPH
jgi:hypothetical protein